MLLGSRSASSYDKRPTTTISSPPDLREAAGAARPVLIANGPDPGVVGIRELGLERLREPTHYDQRGFGVAGWIRLKKTEESVVAAIRSVQPHLVVAAHVSMHGFPVPAAGEPVRRGLRYGNENVEELGAHRLR